MTCEKAVVCRSLSLAGKLSTLTHNATEDLLTAQYEQRPQTQPQMYYTAISFDLPKEYQGYVLLHRSGKETGLTKFNSLIRVIQLRGKRNRLETRSDAKSDAQ